MRVSSLVVKEFKLLVGSFNSVILHLVLVAQFSIVSLIALSALTISQAELNNYFIYLLWLIVLYSGSFSLGRSTQQEIETGMINLYLIKPKNFPKLFLAKHLVNSLLSFIGFLLNLIILVSIQSLSFNSLLALLLVGVFACVAYGSLATILSALSFRSKFSNLVLPLLVLPLICPVFILALNLSAEIVFNSNFLLGSGSFTLLVFLGILYTVIGINTYEYAYKK